ncbi:MAG: hypothetical protein H6765_02530 [Candidatus Peribacteria bacterium]|nr:MAG: hypothetical protein H6765_02530 [Candidatus Peribacteria bacterium]
MAKRDRMMNELRSAGVSNDDAMDQVAKAEIMYIASESQDDRYDKIFGTRFGRWLEDEAADYGQVSGARGVSEGLAKKGNIYEVYDAFRAGGINNLSTKTAIGGLLAMEGKVEDM